MLPRREFSPLGENSLHGIPQEIRGEAQGTDTFRTPRRAAAKSTLVSKTALSTDAIKVALSRIDVGRGGFQRRLAYLPA